MVSEKLTKNERRNATRSLHMDTRALQVGLRHRLPPPPIIDCRLTSDRTACCSVASSCDCT